MKHYFCVGTYTEPILFGTGEVFQGKGNGISICSLEDGAIEVISSIKIRNPSYLCFNQNKKKIYAVNEMKKYQEAYGGGVTQIAYDNQWNMNVEACCNIKGADPCHILLAPNGGFLSIANFASGSVSIVPLDCDGSVDMKNIMLFQHTGSSIHPLRQKGPHAHATIAIPGQDKFFVPDLGTDILYAYHYHGKQVKLCDSEQIMVPPGSGPRTGIFSQNGKDFYVICEISSQIIHYCFKDGIFIKQETVNTLPQDSMVDNICSDIHLTPDGLFLYASNRGHDSLVSYRVHENGSLEFIECQNCGGKTPRAFSIDPTGMFLLCGNQDSDTISIFKIKKDGKLTFEHEIMFHTPVCIQFF